MHCAKLLLFWRRLQRLVMQSPMLHLQQLQGLQRWSPKWRPQALLPARGGWTLRQRLQQLAHVNLP